jgi:hypothetical protein
MFGDKVGRALLVARFDDLEEIQPWVGAMADGTVLLWDSDMLRSVTSKSKSHEEIEAAISDLAFASSTRSIVHVSATHVYTVGWHAKGRTPFDAVAAPSMPRASRDMLIDALRPAVDRERANAPTLTFPDARVHLDRATDLFLGDFAGCASPNMMLGLMDATPAFAREVLANVVRHRQAARAREMAKFDFPPRTGEDRERLAARIDAKWRPVCVVLAAPSCRGVTVFTASGDAVEAPTMKELSAIVEPRAPVIFLGTNIFSRTLVCDLRRARRGLTHVMIKATRGHELARFWVWACNTPMGADAAYPRVVTTLMRQCEWDALSTMRARMARALTRAAQ